LRNKTVYFKDVIAKALAEIDGKISRIKNVDAEGQDLSLAAKTALYDQIDAVD
jgi:preprotein translocase subunit SecA